MRVCGSQAIPGALLGSTSSGFLASFDAKFRTLRSQAETAATEIEQACSCCGRLLIPGAPVPEGCTYRQVLGTTLEAPKLREPVISSTGYVSAVPAV